MSVKSPFTTKTERGGYAAIVYLDGDLCVAEDNVGTVISEQAKADYVSNVIQAAADEIGQGSIFVRKTNDDYIIKSSVAYEGGISLISDGAILDLSNLNATFLTLGTSSTYTNEKPTWVSGFGLIGDTSNINTLFLKAENLRRSLFVSDLSHKEIKNMFEVRGNCYGAQITGVVGKLAGGTWLKVVATDLYYAPNSTFIARCEVSNSGAEDGLGTGISIEASAAYSPYSVSIDNCYFEKFHTGVYTEGYDTRIQNSAFHCKNFNVKINKHATYSAATDSLITGNYFGVYDTGGVGILMAGYGYQTHLIQSNIFYTINGVGIQNGETNIALISKNYFDLSVAASVAIGQTGNNYLRYGFIDTNTFYGDTSTPRGTAISAYATYCDIRNNRFVGVTYWLNQAEIWYALIANNSLFSVTNVTPTVDSSCIIRDNMGYTTENVGTSTGTGAQQTVAHGLNGTPSIVMLGDIEQNAAPYQSAAADGTNIKVTAGNGLDWWWKAEV